MMLETRMGEGYGLHRLRKTRIAEGYGLKSLRENSRGEVEAPAFMRGKARFSAGGARCLPWDPWGWKWIHQQIRQRVRASEFA